MSDSGHRPILPNPGVELVFEMVRQWARGQECSTGGGVIFSATAAPMSDGGAAVIR